MWSINSKPESGKIFLPPRIWKEISFSWIFLLLWVWKVTSISHLFWRYGGDLFSLGLFCPCHQKQKQWWFWPLQDSDNLKLTIRSPNKWSVIFSLAVIALYKFISCVLKWCLCVYAMFLVISSWTVAYSSRFRLFTVFHFCLTNSTLLVSWDFYVCSDPNVAKHYMNNSGLDCTHGFTL